MKISFVGPKPLISHTGVGFDNNKEDKYVYINIAIQMYKAIHHNYMDDKIYTYYTQSDRLSDKELEENIIKYCPEFIEEATKRYEQAQEEIDDLLERARHNITLDDESKNVLMNNISLMRDYIIQRAVNKVAYYCIIDKLAQEVKKDHLDYVIVPMFQKFAHVLHSIQGILEKQKFPIDSELEIFEEHGKLLAKLNVSNF